MFSKELSSDEFLTEKHTYKSSQSSLKKHIRVPWLLQNQTKKANKTWSTFPMIKRTVTCLAGIDYKDFVVLGETGSN